MNAPCKNCVAPKRHPGCHATCPDYILEKTKHNKLKEKIKNEKINTYDLCEGVGRLYRKRGKKGKEY